MQHEGQMLVHIAAHIDADDYHRWINKCVQCGSHETRAVWNKESAGAAQIGPVAQAFSALRPHGPVAVS